jgi:hypothetical protein
MKPGRDERENEQPDLPLFRSWRGVYLFVLGCFLAYVLLLGVLTRAFS